MPVNLSGSLNLCNFFGIVNALNILERNEFGISSACAYFFGRTVGEKWMVTEKIKSGSRVEAVVSHPWLSSNIILNMHNAVSYFCSKILICFCQYIYDTCVASASSFQDITVTQNCQTRRTIPYKGCSFAILTSLGQKVHRYIQWQNHVFPTNCIGLAHPTASPATEQLLLNIYIK